MAATPGAAAAVVGTAVAGAAVGVAVVPQADNKIVTTNIKAIILKAILLVRITLFSPSIPRCLYDNFAELAYRMRIYSVVAPPILAIIFIVVSSNRQHMIM
jgi:hypothetical protein